MSIQSFFAGVVKLFVQPIMTTNHLVWLLLNKQPSLTNISRAMVEAT